MKTKTKTKFIWCHFWCTFWWLPKLFIPWKIDSCPNWITVLWKLHGLMCPLKKLWPAKLRRGWLTANGQQGGIHTESMVDAEVVDNIKEMDEIMRRRSSHLELYHWTPEWEKVWSWLSAHFFLLLACILITIFYKKYCTLTCRNKRESYLIVLKQLGMLKMWG